MKKILFVVLVVGLMGCADTPNTWKALEKELYNTAVEFVALRETNPKLVERDFITPTTKLRGDISTEPPSVLFTITVLSVTNTVIIDKAKIDFNRYYGEPKHDFMSVGENVLVWFVDPDQAIANNWYVAASLGYFDEDSDYMLILMFTEESLSQFIP